MKKSSYCSNLLMPICKLAQQLSISCQWEKKKSYLKNFFPKQIIWLIYQSDLVSNPGLWERCEVDNYHIYQSGIHLFEKVLWFLGRSFRTFPLNLPNFWNFSCLLKNLKSSLGSLDVLLYCWSWTTSNKAFWNWRFTARKHFMNFNFGFLVLVLKTLSPLKARI